MDVERAKSDIRQVSLTTCIASIVAIRSLQILIVRELVPGVEHLISMHDLRALIEVSDCFLVVSCVDRHYTAIQVVVLLVEDVLFVVVGFFCFLCICGVIATVSSL